MIDPSKNTPVTVENGYYQYRIWVSFDAATSASVELIGVMVETGHQTYLPVLKR